MLIKNFLKMAAFASACLLLSACSTTEQSKLANGNLNPHSDSAVAQGLSGVGSFANDENNAHPLEVGNQTYYFDFDKSFIFDKDKASLAVQARYLISHPQAKILIAGNTDERGSREYNIALGRRRACSIQEFLLQNGVNQQQILTVSYGAEKPVAFGRSAEDYAKNRRADLQYQTPIITDKT